MKTKKTMKGIHGPSPAAINGVFIGNMDSRGFGYWFGDPPAMFSRMEVSAWMFFIR